jgi:hypothetical protein
MEQDILEVVYLENKGLHGWGFFAIPIQSIFFTPPLTSFDLTSSVMILSVKDLKEWPGKT